MRRRPAARKRHQGPLTQMASTSLFSVSVPFAERSSIGGRPKGRVACCLRSSTANRRPWRGRWPQYDWPPERLADKGLMRRENARAANVRETRDEKTDASRHADHDVSQLQFGRKESVFWRDKRQAHQLGNHHGSFATATQCSCGQEEMTRRETPIFHFAPPESGAPRRGCRRGA